MDQKWKGWKCRTAIATGITIWCALVGIAYAQTGGNPAAAARAFLEASQVFFHPRCVNCHPAGDAPLQGDNMRPHSCR
jgi:hypothetical protein